MGDVIPIGRNKNNKLGLCTIEVRPDHVSEKIPSEFYDLVRSASGPPITGMEEPLPDVRSRTRRMLDWYRNNIRIVAVFCWGWNLGFLLATVIYLLSNR